MWRPRSWSDWACCFPMTTSRSTGRERSSQATMGVQVRGHDVKPAIGPSDRGRLRLLHVGTQDADRRLRSALPADSADLATVATLGEAAALASAGTADLVLVDTAVDGGPL